MIQLAKNSFFTILDLALYPLIMIIITPFFINNLGSVVFGIWMTAGVIVQYVYVLNFGFAESAIKLISTNYKEKTHSDDLGNLFSVACLFAVFSILVSCILVYTNVFNNWFSIPYNEQKNANTLLIVYLLSTSLRLPEIVILSAFKGIERFDIASIFSLLSKNLPLLITFIGVYINIELSSSMFYGFLCFIVIFITEFFYFNWYCKHQQLFFRIKSLRLLKHQVWFWIQNTVGLVGFLADKMVVGYFTNIVVSGYYAIASMIASQLYNGFNALGTFAFPKAQQNQSNKDILIKLFYKAKGLLSLLSVLLILIMLCFKNYLFLFWLKDEVYANSIEYITLYLVYILIFSHAIIPNQFINASINPKLNAINEIVYRLFQFVFMLIGYYFSGIKGILFSLIFTGSIYLAFQNFIIETKVFNIKTNTTAFLFLFGILYFCIIYFQYNIYITAILLFLLMLLYYKLFLSNVIKLK